MRKILLLTTLLTILGGASFVKASKTIGTEYTSIGDLEGKAFAIVNEDAGKALYHREKPSPFTMGYDIYQTAFYCSTLHYLYKIEASGEDGKYYIRCVTEDGNDFSNNYLESDANETFLYSKDIAGTNTALWQIAYVADKGWTMYNVAKEGYSDGSNNAATNVEPTYLTFCQVVNTDPTITISNAESIAQTLESNPENFTEITQVQNQEPGGVFNLADITSGDGFTQYTFHDNVSFAFKMVNEDVSECDFIIFKFAEAIPGNLKYSFWNGQDNADLTSAITEFKYVFADDANCAINNGIIPQITLFTMWNGSGTVAKVKGVYKHTAIDCTRTYSFNAALDFTGVTGLEAYVITAFNAEAGTLTLSRVYQVPANTGLYLVSKGGDYEIPTIDSASPIATNLLKPSGSGTISKTDGDNTNLVLAGSGDSRGFHPLSADGNMGTNKAYLQLPTSEYNDFASSGVKMRFIFEDAVADAITEVNKPKVTDSAWYTINGVKLNTKPSQKGIYINNGKKVAIQ